MYLTQNNIYDALSGLNYISLLGENDSYRLSRMLVLEKGSVLGCSDTLYICSVEALPPAQLISNQNVCIVCIGSEEQCREYADQTGLGLIVVTQENSLLSVINQLYSFFNRLLIWSYKLISKIAAGSDMQSLINIAGEIFADNPVLLINSSYNIIGTSVESIPEEENPRVYQLLHNGYYSKDTTDALARMGYMQSPNQYSKATYELPPNYMNCPFMIDTFFNKNAYYGFIVVYFTKGKEPTEGEKEIFCYFVKKIKNYYFESCKKDESLPLPLEVFIDDLLHHSREDEEFLKDRARSLHIPLDATYRVCVIKWKEYNRRQAEYILWRIRHGVNFPYHRLLLYHDSILILLDGNFSSLKVREQALSSFEEFISILEIGGGRAGFSLSQFPLMKMNVAYEQALAALHYGQMLSPEKSVYFYSFYYIYEILSAFGKNYDLRDVYVKKLEQLRNTPDDPFDNYHLLKTFILSERSISTTARMMHMHRNSVIYRLNKIKELLSVNLDDPDVRLRLMMSFKVNDLLQKKIDTDYYGELEGLADKIDN